MTENNKATEVTSDNIMEFLKAHMVMNEDFQGFKKDVDKRFEQVATKKDIEHLDARLAEIQLELERIKSQLDDVEKRLKDDTDALAKEVLNLKSRVAILERELGVQRASPRV